jgi:hypothetical protein
MKSSRKNIYIVGALVLAIIAGVVYFCPQYFFSYQEFSCCGGAPPTSYQVCHGREQIVYDAREVDGGMVKRCYGWLETIKVQKTQ